MSFIIEKALVRINKKVDALIAMSTDRVSANKTAYISIIKDSTKIILIGCLYHTLDKVGNNFDTPELKTFITKIRHLVSNLHNAKRLFRQFDSEETCLAEYAVIRWWNDWVQQVKKLIWELIRLNILLIYYNLMISV